MADMEKDERRQPLVVAEKIQQHISFHSLRWPNSNTDNGSESQLVEIWFKRGLRWRRRLEEEGGGVNKVAEKKVKDWDSMSLSEKAVELYVGEKGLLFWLNNFAYAFIFIVIGGWILFQFVGPFLNLFRFMGIAVQLYDAIGVVLFTMTSLDPQSKQPQTLTHSRCSMKYLREIWRYR